MTKKLTWQFPYGMNLTPTGSNHASIETFRDNVIESLTREVIQNSLDVSNKKLEKPVHVSFKKIKLKNTAIPDLKTLTDYGLLKAKDYWKDNRDTLRYLEKFEKAIISPTIDVLKISDYNTTGLLPANFRSLIYSDAYSEKRDDTAAGSKGIGKAAPFAASDLRMVFYSSLANDNTSRSAGILNFVSFQPGEIENEVTQSRAAYLQENKAINQQITFNQKKRKNNEYGTDLFVMGFKNFDNWAEEIKLSTLENFIVAIYQEKLTVSIDGDIINKETIKELLSEFEKKKLLKKDRNRVISVANYYDVLNSKETKRFEFDERFEKYEFIKKSSDGILLMKDHQPSTRKVLQTRQAGMKIYERDRISGTINFTAIFQAVGDELNRYLREIENPNHNDWSVDRIDQDDKEGKKIASNLLTDLLQWYKEKVKDSFEDEIKDKIGAFGVANLLPILSDDKENEKDSEEEKEGGIQFKIKSVDTGKKKKPSIPRGNIEDEDAELAKLAAELDNSGEKQGFSGDEGHGKGGPSGKLTNGKYNNGKSTGGYLGEDGEEYNRRVSYRKLKESKVLKVKIIEKDASVGLYQLVGKHLGNHKKLALEFNYIDARGMKEKARLIDVEADQGYITIKNNKLILKNLKKNQLVNVLFKVDKKIRLKMRIDIYEIRS